MKSLLDEIYFVPSGHLYILMTLFLQLLEYVVIVLNQQVLNSNRHMTFTFNGRYILILCFYDFFSDKSAYFKCGFFFLNISSYEIMVTSYLCPASMSLIESSCYTIYLFVTQGFNF